MNSQTSISRDQSRQEIIFHCDCDFAKKVLLAGSFTGGDNDPIQMRRAADGSWETKLFLAPGRYHYKFLVDGARQGVSDAADIWLNPSGISDHFLEIS